jgi:hypothetical protein
MGIPRNRVSTGTSTVPPPKPVSDPSRPANILATNISTNISSLVARLNIPKNRLSRVYKTNPFKVIINSYNACCSY